MKTIKLIFKIIGGGIAYVVFMVLATRKERKFANEAIRRVFKKIDEDPDGNFFEEYDQMEILEKLYTLGYSFDMNDDEIAWSAKKAAFLLELLL